jgi:hypothetical protein
LTNSETETNEVVEEEVIPDEEIPLDPVTDRMFEVAKIGPYAEAKETEEAEETVAEAEEAVEEEATEPEEDSATLPDGTVVTIEELGKGYLRQGDYTKKTQDLAEQRKAIEKNQDLINYIGSDPALQKMILDHMRGETVKPNVEETTSGLQVPDNYKEDPFVTQLVGKLNEQDAVIRKLDGGYQNITQETKAKQEQSEHQTKLYARLEPAYNELKGQVETPPTPQEFTQAIQAYFVENNIDPNQGAYEIANSVDPNYLTGLVGRIYKADIQKATESETKVVEKNRTKRTAKGATLRVAGKSSQAPKPTLPKLPNGRVDGDALVRMQILEHQKQQRG